MAQAECMGGDDVKALRTKLWDGYDATVRPSRNYSNPTVVTLLLTISFVMGLESRTQQIFLRAILNVWDPKKFGGIDHILVPQSIVWNPDIMLQHSSSEFDPFDTQNILVSVTYQGRVTWEPQFFLRSSCKVNVTDYPFDTNVCPVSIISWMSDNNTVDFRWPAVPIKMKNSVANEDFKISSAGVTKYVYKNNGDCFEAVDFHIKLSRRPLYIVLSVQLPVTLLGLCSIVPFIMPPEESGKVGIAMTVLLSFTVFLDVVDHKLPPSSDKICGLIVYISCLMAVSFLSVLGNVLVVALRDWDEAAGKKAIQSNNFDNNVGKNAIEGNETNIYSTRAHDDLWEEDISSYTSDLPKVTFSKTPTSHFLLRGTRATRLNKMFFIIACILVALSLIAQIYFNV